MSQEISLFRNFGIATPNTITFSKSLNALVGVGYTSMAGNTYFNSLRMADGILIKEDIGQGYAHSFLNGLHIYDIRTKTLICEKLFSCHYYSRDTAKSDAIDMLTDMIGKAASKENIILNYNEMRSKVSDIVRRAFFADQMQEIQKTLKQLSA
ncbi:MAG: hypothetical protein IJ776_00915 [Paludibacteraceae bacterium]|nr:hypothetical protein [Paludibacteraceae bacterium]